MEALTLFILVTLKAFSQGLIAAFKGFVAVCIMSVSYFVAKILIYLPLMKGIWVNKEHVAAAFDECRFIVLYIGATVSIVSFVISCLAKFAEEY
jgi:membrane protease YdiL (CAAX protease family)